jgi:hypothetical protein
MHKYVTGHWAASTFSIESSRTDHALFLSPDGTFRWVSESSADRSLHHGRWQHNAEQAVLMLTGTDDMDQPIVQSWSIHYVSGCEASNTILVLRRAALASLNQPILFQRIHPPDDPVWRTDPTEG